MIARCDRRARRAAAIRFRRPAALIAAALWLVPGAGFGYVLPGLQILDLAAQKSGQSVSLLVTQTVTVYGAQRAETAALPSAGELSSAPTAEPGSADDPNQRDAAGPDPTQELAETLRYDISGAFRSEQFGTGWQRIHVSSGERTITILNGRISSRSETADDRYKEMVLYRSRQALADRLTRAGVDVSVSSLGRLEGQVAYVLGAQYPDETVSQLWVDKETFRPVRWIIGESGVLSALDIRYHEWRPRGPVWYPMHIEFFRGGRLVREIQSRSVELNPAFSRDLFDIAGIERMYPQTAPSASEPDQPGRIQKTLERFREIFQ